MSERPAPAFLVPLLPVLAVVLLGAHAVRGGDLGLAAAWLFLAVLACTRQGWARLVVGLALFAGSLFWVQTGVELVRFRMASGADWHRLAIIMSMVTATAVAGWLSLLWSRGAVRYGHHAATRHAQAAAFVLVVVLLGIARMKARTVTLLLAERYLPGSGPLMLVLAGTYAAWATGQLLDRKRARKLRPRLWLAFSLIFFGQLALGLLGLEHMLMTGRLHLPIPALIVAGPLFRGDGLFMLILFGVSVLLVGPAWCSHLCYVGAWDDVCARATRPRIGRGLARWSWWVRVAVALLVFGTAAGLRLAGTSTGMALVLASFFGLVSIGVMVGISRRLGIMTHCASFCPMGLLANLAGRIAPWRIRIGQGCTRCHACVAVCRYGALTPEILADTAPKPGLTCTLCRECLAVCHHGALAFHAPGISPGKAETVFVTLVVALHTVFLVVARV